MAATLDPMERLDTWVMIANEERVARALHAADRAGTWDACANKALWLRWARVAIKAMEKHKE